MEYNDYDIMLKYQLANARSKSTYFGSPSIYEDGKSLEIFPEDGDKVNGTTPLFVFGTVVYLRYKDKFLILDQNKDDKVVDTLVGLGGKVRPILGTVVQSGEKNDIAKIISAYQSGHLDTLEEMRLAAAREVMEETSTYKKDESGHYTHEVTSDGISINPDLLNTIGTSRIRIITPTKTECWMILNFVYELSQEEYEFIEAKVSKSNREGNLQWLSLDEAVPSMSASDGFILKNIDKKVSVSEIRDGLNNQNVMRFTFEIGPKEYTGTQINGSLVYTSDDKICELLDINPEKSPFDR